MHAWNQNFLPTLVIVLSVSFVQPHPSGAPSQACSDLSPQHNGTPSTSKSPYTLNEVMFRDVDVPDISNTYSYAPSRTYEIKLRVSLVDPPPSTQFRGFFIQARLVADDSNVGGFLSGDGYRLSSCSPPTIGATHSNDELKTSVTVRWMAPPVSTGPIQFRYTIVESRLVYWEGIQSPQIIERRCDISDTGQLYYDSTSGNCVQSCPVGFRGTFATGTCNPFSENYLASYSADVFYSRIENSTASETTLINYTMVMDRRTFTGGVSEAQLSLVDTKTETYFKVSGGTTSTRYSGNAIVIDGSFMIIRDSIMVINTLENPVPLDTFSFTLRTIIAGITNFGTTYISRIARGVVEVVNSIPEQPDTVTQPEAVRSTQPEAVTSTQLDAVTSTQPEAVTSTQPEAEAVRPTQPEAVMSTQPEVVTSTQPEAVTSIQLDAVTSTQPEAVTSIQLDAVTSTQPEAVTSTQLDAVMSTQPKAEAVRSTRPEAVTFTQPQAIASTEPLEIPDPLTTTQITSPTPMTTTSHVQRFDGCAAETVYLPLGNLEWRDAHIGEVVTIQCPCGNMSAVSGVNLNRTASRRCGGNVTTGGAWDDGMISPCNFSTATRQLCQLASVINDSEATTMELKMIVREVEMITREAEDIGVNEFTVATSLIEAVSTLANEDRNLTQSLLEVVDNLLAVSPDNIRKSQQESNATARILNVVEDIASNIPLTQNETSKTIQLKSFAVGVKDIQDTQKFEGHFMSFNTEGNYTYAIGFEEEAEPATATLSIAPDFFKELNGNIPSLRENMGNSAQDATSLRIVNAVYLTDALFPRINSSRNTSIGSIILSSTLFNISQNGSREVRVTNIDPPITLTFMRNQSFITTHNAITTCNFWDFQAENGIGDWSTMNCTLVSDNSDPKAVCQCTHFTNFAILLDPNPVARNAPPELETFFTAVAYIGAVISILCLIATIITYLTTKKLRTSEFGQLLVNLCFGLLGVYILFIICLHATWNMYMCAVAGGLLHYFLLVSFLLMAAEAINLFMKLVIVVGIPPVFKNRFVLKAALISWISPLVIVAASEAPDYTNYIRNNDNSNDTEFCRPYGLPFYGGLVAPFAVIYVLNWAAFIAILASLCRKLTTSADPGQGKKNEMRKKLKQQFVIAMALSVLFGLGWGFGFTATTSIPQLGVSATLQAIFILLTGSQGPLLFVMHCVRNEDARKKWQGWAQALTGKGSSFSSTKPTSGPLLGSAGSKGPATSFGLLSFSARSDSSNAFKNIGSSTFKGGETTFFSEATLEAEKKD